VQIRCAQPNCCWVPFIQSKDMNQNDGNGFGENTPYIPGIYNYCDRWCERCRFTTRCLNCTLVEEKFGDLEDGDINNVAFWERLTETFQEALTMLHKIAGEEGICLEAITGEESTGGEKASEEEGVVSLILHLSEDYISRVADWFEENEYRLKKELRHHKGNPGLRVISSQTPKAGVAVRDALETIRWYQYQIHVKLDRALKSRKTEDSQDEIDFPKDSDGSAKVALLGIDRSITAWDALSKYLPGETEPILKTSIFLHRLRVRIEKQFPEAKGFIRPGFDEAV